MILALAPIYSLLPKTKTPLSSISKNLTLNLTTANNPSTLPQPHLSLESPLNTLLHITHIHITAILLICQKKLNPDRVQTKLQPMPGLY